MQAKAANVDEYISRFPEATQKHLNDVRNAIRKAAPKAEELISYQMPAYKFHGVLVYFAGYQNHIGFYPTATGISNFKKEISGYKSAKGSVQFPLDRPMPVPLIKKIIAFKVKDNLEREAAKLHKKKTKTAKKK